jgi:pimeloyl-ACP methyl ester carboxylesterase
VAVVWRRRREDVGGLDLNVRELVGDGPTLLLLHGLGASGAVWQGIGRRLNPAFRLVAPDLRGHGESAKPSAGYLPRDYVGDMAAFLGHEPACPVHVIGHSLGAVVGAQLASERPELVDKLVVIDPPFDPDRPRTHVETVQQLRHEPRGALERYLQGQESGMGDLYARALADLFRMAADGTFHAVLRGEPGFPSARAMLPSIQAPTLLVAADPSLDGALSAEAARDVAASIPNSRLLTLPGARHAVHASHPRELAAAVLEFLSDSNGPKP